MDLDGHLVHVEFEDVEDSTSDEDDTEVPPFVLPSETLDYSETWQS